jgi:drug/metabolite transporter (DMT)-like permease
MTRGGVLALVAAAACWGSTVVMLRYASRGLGIFALTGIEVSAAALVLAALLLVRRQRLPRPSARLVLGGVLEPGLAYVLINAGITRTSAAHAALLVGTESVFVVLLAAAISRRRPAISTLVGLGFATCGAALLAESGSNAATPTGDLLVLVGVLAAAAYVVTVRPISGDVDPLAMTSYQFFVGWLVTVPLLAIGSATGVVDPLGTISANYALVAAASGVVGSTLAFGLYNWALSRTSAALAGTSLTLIPVFGLLFAVIFLGDPLTARTLIAAGAVLIGLALTTLGERFVHLTERVDELAVGGVVHRAGDDRDRVGRERLAQRRQ